MRSVRPAAAVLSVLLTVPFLASCTSVSGSANPAAAPAGSTTALTVGGSAADISGSATYTSGSPANTSGSPADTGGSPANAGSSAANGIGATCSYPADGAPAKPVSPPTDVMPNAGTVTATLQLTGGAVVIEMDRSKTPCTIGSFVHLADAGYFDGTTCHRLTTSAGLRVLQCGDPTGSGGGGPGYTFGDETDSAMTYPAGTVAMANAGPDTNGSQFFLVYSDSQLPPDYTVFGTIKSGLDVLIKIAVAGVADGGQDGAPASPITISKVTVGT